MIGAGTSLLFDRRAGKAGPPVPPFNKAMVDAWFMSGLSNNDRPSSVRGGQKEMIQLLRTSPAPFLLDSGNIQ